MKKRYEEGGEVEFETKMGENENIGDDVRARAMAAMAARDSGAETAQPTKPKATAPKAEPKKAEAKKKTSSFAGKTSAFKNAKTSFKSGGSVSSASKRGDGCAVKGKTKGRMV